MVNQDQMYNDRTAQSIFKMQKNTARCKNVRWLRAAPISRADVSDSLVRTVNHACGCRRALLDQHRKVRQQRYTNPEIGERKKHKKRTETTTQKSSWSAEKYELLRPR